MKKLIKGITFSYNRNIGWQDRVIRAIIGAGAAIGSVYFMKAIRLMRSCLVCWPFHFSQRFFRHDASFAILQVSAL